MSLPKVITILVTFGCKIETTLVGFWKLFFGSQARPSQPPLPSPVATPQKKKPLVEEMKMPLPQQLVKELVVELAKFKVPAAPTFAKTKRESETLKTMSSDPSSCGG